MLRNLFGHGGLDLKCAGLSRPVIGLEELSTATQNNQDSAHTSTSNAATQGPQGKNIKTKGHSEPQTNLAISPEMPNTNTSFEIVHILAANGTCFCKKRMDTKGSPILIDYQRCINVGLDNQPSTCLEILTAAFWDEIERQIQNHQTADTTGEEEITTTKGIPLGYITSAAFTQ